MDNTIEIPVITTYQEPRINFDVILLSLNWYRPKDPRTPLGMAYIASYSNKYLSFTVEHKLELLEFDVRDNLSTVIHSILIYNPKILGIGVYCWNVDATNKILTSLRGLGYQDIIVLGGPEITYGNNTLPVEYPQADYFVKGDGEQAFAEIVQAIAQNREPHMMGIFSKTDTNFQDLAELVSLDIVPPPHTVADLLPRINGTGFTRWQTQRGCVFKCTFCAFRRPNGSMHETSLARIEEELQNFVKLNILEVAVLDPVFFLNRDRSMNILKLIEKIAPNIRFEIQTRLEHLNDALIEQIAKLNIVLECGIQTLDKKVQRIIKRTNNPIKVTENMKKLTDAKIPFETHLIYGLPEQILESFLHDLDVLLISGSILIRLFPLSILKGTFLEEQILREYKEQFKFSTIFPKEIIHSTWMDSKTIFVLKHLQESVDKYLEIKDTQTGISKSAKELFTDTSKILFNK